VLANLQVLAVPLRFDTIRLHEVGEGDTFTMVVESSGTARQHYIITPRDDEDCFKLHLLGKIVPSLVRPSKEPLPEFRSDHVHSLQVSSLNSQLLVVISTQQGAYSLAYFKSLIHVCRACAGLCDAVS
jgi:hypothetical protein